jgi:hypothetical protein
MMYLYLKTHNVTGYRYLGKTVRDPFKYRGSGILWQRHITKHGNDVSTLVLLATEDKRELAETGLFFSKLYNVVIDPSFANLTEESGQGGFTKYTKARNEKISKALRGRSAPWIKKGKNAGKVAAINTTTGARVSITQEEFEQGPFVGVGTLNRGQPRPTTRGENNHASGKRWYTDGVQNARFIPGTESSDFVLGRVRKT